MIERVIVLPTQDNDGRSLAYRVRKIESEILRIAGGYSRVRQSGAWLDDDGTVYHDSSIRITTTVDDVKDAALVEMLPVWCEQLRQVCLYTHKNDVSADFVYARSQETVIVA